MSPAGLSHGRLKEDAGFSLIELLVVMLVIGILAAIAIPNFVGQKTKAVDVQAKEMARTAETTAETVATENDGSYEHVTREELHSVEPSLGLEAENGGAYLSGVTHGEQEYSVTATASNGDEYTISKSASGEVSRSCFSPISKTGCAGAESSSW
jgi:type IV pilus assembly protein PilA